MNLLIKTLHSSIKDNRNILLFIISLAPFYFLLGNLFINLFFIVLCLIFINKIFKKDEREFLKDPIFWLILFFAFSLLINIFFSVDPINSLPRILKVFIAIGFIFLVKKSLINQKSLFEKKIFGTWSIIFLIVFFDIIFEIIFGFNTIGFTSYYPGRIASFFNDELVAGSFFLGFSFFTLSYFLNFFSQYKKTIIIYVLITILVSFLIGERANFIKFLLGISIFILITQRAKWKIYVVGFFSLFLLLSTIIYFSTNYKYRYIVQVDKIFKNDGISNYLKESQYGAHYNSAYRIFKNYPIFGIGIKNYRKEVIKDEYENKDYTQTLARWGTHPHQVHFEFLSETGLFGYVIFLFFIFSSIYLSCKNYIKHKNNFQLSGILFVTLSIIPLLPSGSFFSTFPAGLFWINYAIMVSYIKK